MKIYTSYFYQVRFFTPNTIPLSTAVWDPKWFHNYRPQSFSFVDKNGVINGLRATPFVPGATCSNLCRGPETCTTTPDHCQFLAKYAEQLNAIPITDTIIRIENLTAKVQSFLHFTDTPVIVFLVHEPPYKACSERLTIQNYFNSHNILCTEWHHPIT